MVQHKPTPEEQLLKLIEGSGSGASETAPASSEKSPAGKSKGAAVLGKIGKLPGFLDYAKKVFLKNGHPSLGAGLAFNIKTLNRVLLALVIAAALFLIIDLVFLKAGDNKFLSQVSTTDAVYPLHKGGMEKISSDISTYKTAVQKRNPFLPPSAIVISGPANSGAPGAGPVATTGTLAEALQGIKLVGISWSDNPLAMIEDVSTGRTYFLRKNQEMKGIKVQEISKEKVSVTYQGQEGELF